ncbi:FkbM family methyltransferase, partial [Helicobacter suis]|uniref:FkbM family methyltransferase n=1 Tax=Helicobacter suis TaxID=104628 RepID=UPI001F07491A
MIQRQREREREGKQPVALSLGVSDWSPWDLEMAQKGYLVLQYDGSIEKSPDSHKNIIFHQKFVGTKNDSKTISLEQILQDYNFDVNAHNILQMDIEGAEWDIFEKLDFVLLEKYFAQIIVEFHWIDPRNRFQSERYLAILEKFNKAF